MDLVAGIAVYVMPCHDCGIYSKHLWTLYHDACETICLHSIVMLYLYIMYLYGLWPEIKSYYYYIMQVMPGVSLRARWDATLVKGNKGIKQK